MERVRRGREKGEGREGERRDEGGEEGEGREGRKEGTRREE